MDGKLKSYAGFRQRTKAFLFDYAGVVLYLGFITGLFAFFNLSTDISQVYFGDRTTAQLSGFLTVTLPIALYFTLGESSLRQATWGKLRMRLIVTNHNGDRIGFWRALTRTVLKFVPWELSHTLIWEIRFSTELDPTTINIGFALVYVLIGLNIASLALSKTKQTLYDFLAGTYVCERE